EVEELLALLRREPAPDVPRRDRERPRGRAELAKAGGHPWILVAVLGRRGGPLGGRGAGRAPGAGAVTPGVRAEAWEASEVSAPAACRAVWEVWEAATSGAAREA